MATTTETFKHGYLLDENLATDGFSTTQVLPGKISIEDPTGNTFRFGSTVEVTDSYNTTQLLYEGTVLENGNVIGFAAIDSASGQTYMFTDQTLPANTSVVIDFGDPFTLCFLAGTAISTPEGERAIETLRAGDLVVTSTGEAKAVRWLGRQTVARTFADPVSVLPIRIEQGALDGVLPVRDLLVSPDHALELGGVLVQAGALVNGTTISRKTDVAETFMYYHVELEDHSLILAEGVAAETFIDNADRRAFDNWDEHPGAAPLAEMDLPRAKSHRQVPSAVRAQIEAVAVARHPLAA